ncbi:hypothetical protein B0H65DRAFT_506580 [Neurospora tetraspora]|uniref:Ankyrin n=1 Tax=Neurospora tetraspora TaxID=94610 RepID=A0AAE0MUM6_9PEZI|nr:hypothetical protein B0H65DRAFT_506580 [Neurospora tetraspora]
MKSFLDLLPVEMVDNIVKFLSTRDANSFAQTFIKKAVEAGADINAPDWLSCFHIPKRYNNDPNEWSLAKAASKDANGSPLHFAALTNNLEAAEYLLQKGATLHNTGLANWALNMCSCHYEDEDRVEPQGNYYEDYLALPLHTAVCHGSLEVAKLFLEHGASVHLHSIRRHLAEAAAKQNHPIKSNDNLLHVLVWKGPDYLASIDLIAQSPDTDINAEEAYSRPHNTVVIEKLAEFGAIETCDRHSESWIIEGCIYGCIHFGLYDNALALLKYCLHASDSEVGRLIRSDAVLLFAKAVTFNARLEEHHVKQVKQIIRMLVQDYGLELNTRLPHTCTEKDTPLEHLIVSSPMPEYLIQLLVDLGARLDIRNGEGHNPLVRCLWMEQSVTKAAQKTKARNKARKKGIREGAEAGSSGSSIIRQQTIRALIQACSWANIRIDEKYTWGKAELTLCRILEIRFPGWKPPEGLGNNRALWKDLVRHIEDSLELGSD